MLDPKIPPTLRAYKKPSSVTLPRLKSPIPPSLFKDNLNNSHPNTICTYYGHYHGSCSYGCCGYKDLGCGYGCCYGWLRLLLLKISYKTVTLCTCTSEFTNLTPHVLNLADVLPYSALWIWYTKLFPFCI